MSLGSCTICGEDACVEYPLLGGSPRFCSSHHNPKDAGPFGCDFSGPDDFDIPFEEYDPFDVWREKGALNHFREIFIWTTKDGRKLHVKEIGDTHLQNIVNLLNRRLDSIPEFEADPQGFTVSTERDQERLSLIIELLEQEQESRGVKRG